MSLAAVAGLPSGGEHAGRRPAAPAWRRDGALGWLLAAAGLILAGNAVVSSRLFADSYYDLYDGRYILAHGIPHRNVATVASHGAPWIDQQWLAHVIYYGAWAAGGYPAVAVLSAALVTAGFAVLGLLMLRRGVPPPRMFGWTLLAFAVCLGNTVVRAQSFGYLFFALTLWLIVTDAELPRPRGRTWLAIPVLVAWANTHGSVLLGAGLLAAYSAGQAARWLLRGGRRRALGYLLLGGCGLAAVAATPYGLATVGYYRLLIGNPVLARYVMEWAPPSPAYPLSWAFFAVLGLVTACVLLGWRRGARPDPVLALIALTLACAALTAIRNQAWFGIGGSLLAADSLARAGAGQAAALRSGFRRAVAAALAGCAAASLLYLAVTPPALYQSGVPVRALDVAASIAARNPALRVIGDDWSGTAMLWLHPGMLGRVGFDIREELYDRAQLTAYFDFLLLQGRRWQRVTSGYGIVVVSLVKYPRLGAALARLPGWHVAYAGHGGLVLVRCGAEPALAAQCG